MNGPDAAKGTVGYGVTGLLGVEVREASAERVVISVPVTWKVHQPFGVLHGGVSALLAETAASIGGSRAVPEGKSVVGIELNASHLRAVSDGELVATAVPLRKGRRIQVWAIDVADGAGRAVCAARCSLAVIDAPAV